MRLFLPADLPGPVVEKLRAGCGQVGRPISISPDKSAERHPEARYRAAGGALVTAWK